MPYVLRSIVVPYGTQLKTNNTMAKRNLKLENLLAELSVNEVVPAKVIQAEEFTNAKVVVNRQHSISVASYLQKSFVVRKKEKVIAECRTAKEAISFIL
jgi:hypothetical protein